MRIIALPRQALRAFRPAGNSTPPPVALARSAWLHRVSLMLTRSMRAIDKGNTRPS